MTSDPRNWMTSNTIGGTRWIGSSYEVVYIMSAVHQVCDLCEYHTNGHHNHKAIRLLPTLCYAHACSVGVYFKHVSKLHVYTQSALYWHNSPKAYSKCSVLGLACESTFWHIPSLPQCLSWLCMLSVLSSNLVKTLFFLSLKSLIITAHDNGTPRQVRGTYVTIPKECGLDHVGGTRGCESRAWISPCKRPPRIRS